MRMVINKYGNLEIEDNILKFRMPLSEFNTDEITVIEKNIKRKMAAVEGIPYYLKPFEIQVINSSVILYYRMENYASFNYLRQLTFSEKLKYYLSLIEIAKFQDETKVLWDRYNFFIDPLEENIKTVVFETENMKVNEKLDAFNGVKELILISLTTLEKILGKPSRVDFIEQDEEIIQFAETILKIEELDDLGHYISTKQIDYEHDLIFGKKSSFQENNSVKESKKLDLFKLKGNKKKTSGKINKKKSNKTIFILLALLGFAIIFNLSMGNGANVKNSKKEEVISSEYDNKKQITKDDGKNPKVKTSSKYSDKLLEAYRSTLLGDSKKAIEILETIGYNNLSESDQAVLLSIYEKAGEINKVIDINPKRAKELVNLLVANNQANKLVDIQKLMETKNPYVDFEVAYLEQDWKKVIEIKDNIDLNGKKEEQIIDAYISLEKFDEGKKFAEMVGNPALLERINAYLVTKE
jgi:hypothetical protein